MATATNIYRRLVMFDDIHKTSIPFRNHISCLRSSGIRPDVRVHDGLIQPKLATSSPQYGMSVFRQLLEDWIFTDFGEERATMLFECGAPAKIKAYRSINGKKATLALLYEIEESDLVTGLNAIRHPETNEV